MNNNICICIYYIFMLLKIYTHRTFNQFFNTTFEQKTNLSLSYKQIKSISRFRLQHYSNNNVENKIFLGHDNHGSKQVSIGGKNNNRLKIVFYY